ncbi:MAG: tetratricopeptide repeat protein [Acidobacteria bacterium]|nr:tetratricopeptide repeat protein [Acidobacteriota bacterium]
MRNKYGKTYNPLMAKNQSRLRLPVLLILGCIFSSLPVTAQIHLADPGYVHNHKANKLFESGKYQAALQEYIQALSRRDNSPKIKYNMANTFLKSGRIKDAIKTYNDLLNSAPKELKPRLYYNTGNALYQAKKYRDAAGFYRKALLADPKDRWAKENYEMSLRKIREQKQNQQQKKKKQNDKKKKNNKKQQPKQQKQNQQNMKKEQKQQKQQPSEQQKKMERVKRMLKALREQEKQDRKKNARKKAARPVERNVKDW